MKNSSKIVPSKHVIIYSHGFGVRKDDRGLLTDIAEAFPEVESILFDYFKIDEEAKTLTICPFGEQANKLNQVIEKARLDYPGATVDLICHSQGTIVAALAKPENIRKVIFLAPVFDLGIERTLKRYQDKPGATINLDGESQLPALDGLVRIVPAEYWRERILLKPFDEYNKLANKTEIIVLEANQDEVLPRVDLKELDPKIKVISLDGDHNFTGRARNPLMEVVRKIIMS